MQIDDIHIKSKEINYHVRLTQEKTSPTLILYPGVEGIKGKGTLEALTIDGKTFQDWTKIGTFREKYTVGDLSMSHYLELNLRNKKIQIEQIFSWVFNSTVAEGVIKEKEHWYERWKETRLKNLSVT